jgi:hypothetical protein
MPLQAWNHIDFYDPTTGEMAVRYSGFSGHGEYWLRLPMTGPGKSRRKQRDWALALLAEAIEADDPPGEVAYREPPPESSFGY